MSTLARALLLSLSLASSARAQATERGRAGLFEQLASPDAQRASVLASQAALLVAEAQSALPGDWETTCRTTLGLRVGSDAVATLRGKSRALGELARDALRAQARIQAAATRLERARKLAPNDPSLMHAQAGALSLWQDIGPAWECSVKRRDDEAIALLERVASEHPSYAPERIAFELGVLLTRSLRFAEACAAYARADALAIESDGGMARSNLAETQMLAGELESAVESYSRALEKAQAGHGHALAVWGLSVALERSGDHTRAIERLQRAFGAGGEGMLVLRGEGVFFVPSYEVHAYEALGPEARALALTDPAEQSALLRAAAASHRAFLAGAAHAARTGVQAEASQASYDTTAREGLSRVLSKLDELAKRARKTTRAKTTRAKPTL
jgi:tetratricopeptide (TPR) repeat protein